MTKVGDTVRYLNSVGGGKVVRIDGKIAWVDDEGFETPVLLRECVVVRTAEDDRMVSEAKKNTSPEHVAVAPKSVTAPPLSKEKPSNVNTVSERPIDVTEVPGRDKLNLTLGFEPTERTRVSESDFDGILINDSNYYLYFCFATRQKDEAQLTTRYAGIVEPNTELWLGTFTRAEAAVFDSIVFQYIAYKKDRQFDLKRPGSVEIKVDTTKFFKLHCFRKNQYFENDVLAFTLVRDDEPASKTLEEIETVASKPERTASGRPERKQVRKHSHSPTKERVNLKDPLVVDLHIDNLVDTTSGMSSADMLNLQIDKFQEVMNQNLRNYGRKIVFIHGKGEGVLRHALIKELTHRYGGHDVRDASFREYGYGATQVTIRQHPDKNHDKRTR